MQISTELLESASVVRKANAALATAQQAVREDKARRKISRWARLVDWLFNTRVEVQLAEAHGRLSRAKSNGNQAARQWMVEAAKHELAGNPSDSQCHAEQANRVSSTHKRCQKLGHWFQLADSAHSFLESAADACRSASSMEFLDLVTKNKGIDMLSSWETDSAARSIRSANDAVRALAAALPKRSASSDIDQPSDLLDLMVDLTFEPAFDILSWFNMSKLNDAERDCRRVAEQVAPLKEQLRVAYSEATSKHRTEVQKLTSIEAPYLAKAAARVPDLIRCSPPNSFED
ncbi:hypothetical protein NPS53_08145 [Pseudomonas putida]|uniref:hypothetical protein n=1 Tax=Pseudomonas putida TaxID=303 RepID=UPI0023637C2D|nr:hypothetical protein [Pseudomonas putida]MDD2139541.1 hypothetical protein [Pseudomonas putida]HDS1721464.1 hypothetical protein [Pseudomonas putida]